jgi:hypothetical protein
MSLQTCWRVLAAGFHQVNDGAFHPVPRYEAFRAPQSRNIAFCNTLNHSVIASDGIITTATQTFPRSNPARKELRRCGNVARQAFAGAVRAGG